MEHFFSRTISTVGRIKKIFLLSLLLFTASCGLLFPRADIHVNSISPPENTQIDRKTKIYYDLDYEIYDYQSDTSYEVAVWIYDSNRDEYLQVYTFALSGSKGNIQDSFSSGHFYNCFITCVRKTALPFQIFFRIQTAEGDELASSREFNYDEI